MTQAPSVILAGERDSSRNPHGSAFEDDGLGGQAVLDNVQTDGGASFWCSRAGAFLRVLPVRLELFVRCHCITSLPHDNGRVLGKSADLGCRARQVIGSKRLLFFGWAVN